MKNALILVLIVVAAAATRLIPHPMNFAPLSAMALFGAAYFGRRGMGLLVVMVAWFVSDLVLNNFVYSSLYDGFTLVTTGGAAIYASIVAIYLLGQKLLKKISIGRVAVGALGASVIFFILSNLGVWLTSGMYPINIAGLIECYTLALPFFPNTVLGDLVYCGVLFFVAEWLMSKNILPQRI